ncbi:MAG: MFS transporter, partial [Bacteroidaceae bacterium]
NLVAGIFIVYSLFGLFQNKTAKGKVYAASVMVASVAFLIYKYYTLAPETTVYAPIFQQFNPCFVVALTPISVALFGYLARKGKEPTAPKKIGLGMLVAACGFVIMIMSSLSLPKPEVADNVKNARVLLKQHGELVTKANAADSIYEKIKREDAEEDEKGFLKTYNLKTANATQVTKYLTFIQPKERVAYVKNLPEQKIEEFKSYLKQEERVTANWLILTYLILTFAELLLSPIGISFVSKVAPPQYKGMMMGGWFVATAVGNFLVAIPSLLWEANWDLSYIWAVLVGICLLSALFIFSILKRLNKVA